MKKILLAAAFLLTFSIMIFLPHDAHAVPAFARQTGMACNTCHYQHFPSLNSFGRAFKSGGFTQMGGQSMIEGDLLSVPAVLNASLVLKMRGQKTTGDSGASGTTSGTNKGELQFPDEVALMLGGRAGEHVGFLLESSLKAADAGNRFTNFKLPFTYKAMDTDFSVIPFTSDSAGPSYGFELLNTGAVSMARPIEHGAETSAQRFLGTATSATGFSFVAAHSLFFANYSAWAPTHGDTDAGPYLAYLRAAITPTIAGWDIGAGAQWWGGTTKYGATPTRKSARAWAVDAQAQGNAGDYPVGLYLTYGLAQKSGTGTANIFNSGTADNNKAWSATGEFGIIPSRLTLLAAYLSGKGASLNGNSADGYKNAATVGANFNITQNIELQLNNSWYSGSAFNVTPADGDTKTTLMLFGAF